MASQTHHLAPKPAFTYRSLPGDSSTCVCVNNITLGSALALRSKVWRLKRLTALVSTKYGSENDIDQNKSKLALIRDIHKYFSVFWGLVITFLWPVNHLLGHVVWACDGFRVFRPLFERSHVLMLAVSVCGTVNSVCMFMRVFNPPQITSGA